MRRMTARRRGRPGRSALVLFALLAVGIYLAFDVLDLDGSDLRSPFAGGAAVVPAGGEAEGREIGSTWLSQATTPPTFQDVPLVAASAHPARGGPFLARAYPSRDATPPDPSAEDPA